jgi:hypothetical protein
VERGRGLARRGLLELLPELGRQHLRGEVLGVEAGFLSRFPRVGVLGEIAIVRRIVGHGDTDRGRDEAARLVGGVLAEDDEQDLARLEELEAGRFRDEAAARRVDARDTDEVEGGDAGLAQGLFEADQLLLVAALAARQKDLGRYERPHITSSARPARVL